MGFDINSAMDITKDEKAIPTTTFDISSAEDTNPNPPKEKTYPISSFLRKIFRTSVGEKMQTQQALIGLSKEVDLDVKEGETRKDYENRISGLLEHREKDIVKEGVMRQIEGPMMVMIAGHALKAGQVLPAIMKDKNILKNMFKQTTKFVAERPALSTGVMVGAFSVKDHFFNGRRYIEENFPNAPGLVADSVEVIDFIATAVALGVGFGKAKTFTWGRYKDLNLPKSGKLTPEQASNIKPSVREKLGITEDHLKAAENSGKDIQVPYEKVMDLAANPKEWAAVKEAIGAGKEPVKSAVKPESEGLKIIKESLDKENLARKERNIKISDEEVKAQKFITEESDLAIKQYKAQSAKEFDGADNVISADIGKFAIDSPKRGLKMKAARSGDFHEPGSALKNAVERELLADKSTVDLPTGFTAGGSGSGKSNILRSTTKESGGTVKDNFGLVYDTNFNNYNSVIKKVEANLKDGRDVEILYVYREPMLAWEKGVLPRVATQDRIVPIVEHIKTHKDSLISVRKAAEKYKDNPKVVIEAVDNSFAKGEFKDVALDKVPTADYTNIEGKLYESAKRSYENNEIKLEHLKTAVEGSKELQQRFSKDYPSKSSKTRDSIPKSEQPPTSGLAKSIKKSSVKEGLQEEFGDLPSYEARNMDIIAGKVSAFITDNYTLAKKIALGEAPEQGGLRAQELFTGIRIKAMAEKDFATLRELAVNEKATAMATELGQRVKALDSGEPGNPVKAMRDIRKIRKEIAEKRGHKLEDVDVTIKEAKNITELASDVASTKKAINSGGDRLEYGRARVAYEDYVDGLKIESERIKLVNYVKPPNWLSGLTSIAGFAKSMKASFDNSVVLRQGLKTLFTEPKIWAKNSARTFGDFWNSMTSKVSGKDAMLEVRAEVLSRENSINGLYKKHGLAVGVVEESFPTSAPEKIPLFGDIFKGSQDAFTAWQYRTRADVFDKYVEIAKKTDADISGLGVLVNSLTGRGDIGGLEPIAKGLNNVFFSPRFLKSNIDTLTGGVFNKGRSSFVKKKAAESTLKVIGGVASILAIADAVSPGSVDFDPRTANFGKIKSGNTRFDVNGGMASIVTLASRLISQSSKSSVTDLVTPINSQKFGSITGVDVLVSFFGNKLSPMAGLFRNLVRGHDFNRKRPTVLGEMNNLLTPLPLDNYLELRDDPHSAPLLLSLLAESLGIGTNTYGTDVDWATKIGLELEQFHDRVGDETFKQANSDYNELYGDWFRRMKENDSFQSLSDEDKGLVIRKKRVEIKEKVYKKYHFKYERNKKRKLPKFK